MIRVRLRSDVRCSLQESQGKPYYQLEDPLNSRFYRLGVREWKLARQLDGKRMLREVLLSVQDSEDVLSTKEAVMLVRWLMQVQLATIEGDASHPIFEAAAQAKTPRQIVNPMFLRVPLFNPDALLTFCLPWLAWTLTPGAFVAWCLFCLFAASRVFMYWDRFCSSFSNILAPNNWFFLFLAWVLLKAVHEFYHGLICKKYGGVVPRCGLVFIMFSPIAFVDVTSSWRFRSKWPRIYTAAGGMYVEFFVASVAALIWVETDRPVLAQLCHNIITMASVSTLLFNANCLMRFDGYYILTDLIEVQNLYTTGQQYLRSLSRRYLLGLSVSNSLGDSKRDWVIRVYAFASFVWRWMFYCGIILAAAAMFRGAGIVLAVLGVFLWMLMPAVKFIKFFCYGNGSEQPDRRRFLIVTGTTALIVFGILQLPWPGGVSAVGVVDFEPLAVHRVDSPGFVKAIHVRSGERVKPGQLLATLHNPETTLALAEIELSIEESIVRSRILHRDDDVVNYQVETKRRESLERQRDELAQRVDNLTIYASTEGRVIGRDLDTLVGQYLATGTTVMAIGDEHKKHVELSVAQRDVDFFLRQLNSRPTVRIRGRAGVIQDALLQRVNPRATHRLSHPALAAPNGGSLAVRMQKSEQRADRSSKYELVEPRFLASVELPEGYALGLRAGQLAKARIRADGKSIGGHILGTVRRWMRKKMASRAS